MDASDRLSAYPAGYDPKAYRPFIDGLRAISILAVVGYHVGIGGVSGGYVGVDVFFVISGFLIINQIASAVARGNFSFGEFWSRRVLRILPPYFLTLAVTMIVAPFLLVMPDEYRQFGQEIGHAAAMIINHLFLIQQGYFDTTSDTKILLHLWSLAVEEQFYLVAPCLIVGIWWLAKHKSGDRHQRLMAIAGLTLFILSLAGCILLTPQAGGRNYAFYLTPLRAWEFIAGGAVAAILPYVRKMPREARNALPAIGLLAIGFAIFSYSDETAFPSWRAVIPVAGAVAVICGGMAEGSGPVVHVLSSRIMVGLGLVSYSWYLWHWPLLAFGRIAQVGKSSPLIDYAMGALSLCLAIATFLLVEKPIREWRRRRQRALGWRPIFAAVGLCAATALGGEHVFDATGKEIAAAAAAENPPSSSAPAPYCDLLATPAAKCSEMARGRPLGLLIGDSHALALRNRLAALSEHTGGLLVSAAAGGCMRFVGLTIRIPDDALAATCATLNEHFPADLVAGDLAPAYAVLYARWPIYGASRKAYQLRYDDGSVPDQASAFVAGLKNTIDQLTSHGVKRILVIGPTPLFARPAPGCVYLAKRYGLDPASFCGLSRLEVETEGAEARHRIRTALPDLPAVVRFIDPLDAFCDETSCVPFVGNAMWLLDSNHLSDSGADHLIETYRAEFDWVAGGSSR